MAHHVDKVTMPAFEHFEEYKITEKYRFLNINKVYINMYSIPLVYMYIYIVYNFHIICRGSVGGLRSIKTLGSYTCSKYAYKKAARSKT